MTPFTRTFWELYVSNDTFGHVRDSQAFTPRHGLVDFNIELKIHVHDTVQSFRSPNGPYSTAKTNTTVRGELHRLFADLSALRANMYRY